MHWTERPAVKSTDRMVDFRKGPIIILWIRLSFRDQLPKMAVAFKMLEIK